MSKTLNVIAEAAFNVSLDEDARPSVRRLFEYAGLAIDRLNDLVAVLRNRESE